METIPVSQIDEAEYVGDNGLYRGMTADVKPDPLTYHLELSERKLYARWHGCEGPGGWNLYPVTDFKLLVPVRV